MPLLLTSDRDPLHPSANRVVLALSSIPLWKVSFLVPDLATPMLLVAIPASPPFLYRTSLAANPG